MPNARLSNDKYLFFLSHCFHSTRVRTQGFTSPDLHIKQRSGRRTHSANPLCTDVCARVPDARLNKCIRADSLTASTTGRHCAMLCILIPKTQPKRLVHASRTGYAHCDAEHGGYEASGSTLRAHTHTPSRFPLPGGNGEN